MKEYKNNQNAITLVALVITIIVLLILAGVTIALTLGENGLIKRTEVTTVEHNKGSIKEELDMLIGSKKIDTWGKKLENGELEKELNKIGAVVIVTTEEFIQGEYKDYEFIIDKDGNVIIGAQLSQVKPTGRATLLTTQEGILEAQIQVTGETEDGEIEQIVPLDEVELVQDNGNADKTYKVTENATYRFIIKGSNGRSLLVTCEVSNLMLSRKDIFTAIEDIKVSGIKKVAVKGKTSDGAESVEKYSLNMVNIKGDVQLGEKLLVNGEETTVAGISKSSKVYTVGSASDIGTASGNAQNTVVLKVEGNLNIETGTKLTAIGNQYGGPKGMIVYCTGKITNNGEISMSQRGAKAVGQNVFLLKNESGSFEYIPKDGAVGGDKSTAKSTRKWSICKWKSRSKWNWQKYWWWWLRCCIC